MGQPIERCAVCGQEKHQSGVGRPKSAGGSAAAEGRTALRAGGLSRVIIEGRALLLCRTHAATVVATMPETFEDLRALFVGAAPDLGPARPRDRALEGLVGAEPRPPSEIERRSPVPRRGQEDRRAFPPRPEGRRRAGGRRATDPCD